MKNRNLIAFLLYLLASAGAAAVFANEKPVAIEKSMTDIEKQDTGIAKLTHTELAVLNAWLSARGCVEDTPDDGEAVFGLTTVNAENELQEVHTRIAGVKKDPYGRHILTLENAQTWRLNEKKPVQFKLGDQVTIKKSLWGSFNLKHEASGFIAKARRVK